MTGKEEAVLEHIDFRQRIHETGIARHLSNTALVLLFISLGKEMWRNASEKGPEPPCETPER